MTLDTKVKQGLQNAIQCGRRICAIDPPIDCPQFVYFESVTYFFFRFAFKYVLQKLPRYVSRSSPSHSSW